MKISNPFQKNYRFILGIIFTVLEGFLSASVYMTLYLLILLLVDNNVTMENLMKLTGLIVVIFVVRLVAYAFGYTQGQIGGGAVSRQIRLFLGDKFKKIPLSRFTQGQVGQYVNVMTSDVSGYEQILTHKMGNLVKNISLSAVLLVFVCYMYLPAGVILLAVSLLFIPNCKKVRNSKEYNLCRGCQQHCGIYHRDSDASCLQYVWGKESDYYKRAEKLQRCEL